MKAKSDEKIVEELGSQLKSRRVGHHKMMKEVMRYYGDCPSDISGLDKLRDEDNADIRDNLMDEYVKSFCKATNHTDKEKELAKKWIKQLQELSNTTSGK
jgi:hypothetical protein